MKEDVLKQLYETFRLREREGQGGMKFKYVPNEDVINRMNKIFMGDWSTEVRDKDIVDDQVILEVAVSITDSESGKIHTHSGFGSQQIMRYSKGPNQGKIIDIGNAYKGALSKAIVNACTRWGVGLFKERNAYELDNITPVEEDSGAMSEAAPVTAPITPPNVSVVPSPIETHTAVDNTPIFPTPPTAKPPVNETKPVPVPPAPAVEKIVEFPSTPPAPGQTIAAGISVVQAPAAEMPKVPGPMEQPPKAPEAPKAPTLPFTPQQNGSDKISDVQRVALNGILSMRSINYEDLAKEAFEARGIDRSIPAKEDLSYEDAVVVIKYGNDKYRKGNV